MLLWIIIGGLAAFFYRSFAEMAHEFNRPRTQFGLLGLGIMIGTYLIVGLTLGVLIALTTSLASNIAALLIMEFAVVGVAALITYFIKRGIHNSWKKKRSEAEVLDQQAYQARPAQEDILDQ